MEIIFYINNSEIDTVGKNLTEVGRTEIVALDDSTLEHPIARVNFPEVPKVTYAYIPDYGRYYFVGEAKPLNKQIWSIPLEVDPLNTFAKEIKANKAVIERQEFEFNLYLKDELFPLTEDTFTLTTKIGGQPFTKSYYVLNLANTYGGTPV